MAKRILFVEDQPLSRKGIGTFLRREGYEVEEAKDGAEALGLLDRSQFDLVISDIRLPRVGGIAVISHLRSISPNTPFIILTAFPYDAAAGLSKMQRTAFMSKPVLLEDLKSNIQLLLRGGSVF